MPSDELQARLDQFEAWVRDIRDPANTNAEPEQHHRAGRCTATIQLAPIPGGWAWNAHATSHSDGYHGTPWRGPEPTRDAALQAATDNVVRWLTNPRSHDHPDEAHQLADLLHTAAEPTLF